MVSLGKLGKERRVSQARILGFALFAVFLCLAIGGLGTMAQGAEKGPIKIGFISPHTGNFAQMGLDMVDGFKMYLDEINYTVAGRKIELIVEDEGEIPATAVTKMRKLATHDKVHLVAGVFLTAAAYAVAPVAMEAQTPLIITLSAGDDLTQRKRSKYVTRVSFTCSQFGHVAADYAYKKFGWRKAVTLGMDYGWGHENIGAFQRTFEEMGGKVIQKVWTPMVTADYGPYAASLKRDADGIFEVVTGAASIRFIKTLRSSGLLNKWKVMAPGTATDESLLPALADDGVGVYTVFNYSAALKNPENAKFNERVLKVIKRDPTLGMAHSYTGADWIIRAIKAVNGDVENKDKFIEAVRAVEIPNSLRGPLKLDKYGHVIQNVYIRQVEKVGKAYQNSIVETYPMVSQFWTYDPETFLKSPVYGRDYPPCKFCQ